MGRGFRLSFQLQTRQAPRRAGGISASWGQDPGCSRPGNTVTILLPADLEGWDPLWPSASSIQVKGCCLESWIGDSKVRSLATVWPLIAGLAGGNRP